MTHMKPMYIMLVGLPASGKSYLTNEIRDQADRLFTVLSTDAYVEIAARSQGITYTDAFPMCIKDAMKSMEEDKRRAFFIGASIIHDQTNLSAKSRQGKLAQVNRHYQKIAIYMTTPYSVIFDRLTQRPGKTIGMNIIKEMINRYEPPTLAEGFDVVIPDYMALRLFD